METKANYVLIGAFAIAGFLGMIGFLMWFSNLQLNRQFAYYDAYFPEVTGLTVSSQVLFAGLNVGTVVDMQLAPDNSASVRVRLEMDEDTPVRADSRASIESSAVTGISTVSITPGTGTAPLLREASSESVPVILSGRSTLQTLGEQAPQLLTRLNVLAAQLTTLLGDENQARVAQILTNVERSTGNLDQTMADVSKATEAVSAAATDLAGFGDRLQDLSQSADKTLAQVSGAAEEARTALAGVNGYVSEDLTPLTNQLQASVAALQGDLSRLAGRADTTIDKLDRALDSTTGTFDAAGAVIADLGPVFADLRQTLGRLDDALAGLPDDVPLIAARLRDAAESAAGAFDSLRVMLDSSRRPVQAFTRDALPQFSRLSQELRGLVANMDQLVSSLKRNPAQILRGQPTPEFRR
jgi:phospholipid/cholesterol/gamma-HCH transport system substrate-binding protein